IAKEQRAAYLLAVARRAYLGGDAKSGAANLDAAAKVAGDAHLGVADFRIGVERARQSLAAGDPKQADAIIATLRAETTMLGQVPLRLELEELEIASALRAGRRNDAALRYREALPLLRDAG